MKRYIKKLILSNEDRVITSIEDAISRIDTFCAGSDHSGLSVWMTEPDEFRDKDYGECVETNTDPAMFYVTICGGENGGGTWSNYFQVLHDLFIKLEDIFECVWVIELWNDCIDDVFYAKIGVRQDYGKRKPYIVRNKQEQKEHREQMEKYGYDLSDFIFHASKIERRKQ